MAGPKPPRTPFTRTLVEAAEQLPTRRIPDDPKVHPDPPTRRRAGEVPASRSAPLPVSPRPFVDVAALERALELAGARLGAGESARLVAIAERRLAGRAVEALTTGERDALVAALRDELIRTAPGVAATQRRLREVARGRRNLDVGSDIKLSSAPAPGGTWLFWTSGSRVSPVVVGESFVPTLRGTPVPARPDPTRAGLPTQVRWQARDGTIGSVAPPMPPSPAHAATGLDADALRSAPDLVLAEVTRARTAALEAAARDLRPAGRPLTDTPRTAGVGVHRIEVFRPRTDAPGRVFDELVVFSGRVGPEGRRLPSASLDAILPSPGTISDELAGMARLHGWGAIFADETLVGLSYGPHQALNLLQLATVEGFARWGGRSTGRLNLRAGLPTTLSLYLAQRPVRLRGGGTARFPFLRTAVYRFELGEGRFVNAVLDVTPEGAVDAFLTP